MSDASSPSPIAASANATNTDGRSVGRSNPSVSSDEPLVVIALAPAVLLETDEDARERRRR